MATIQFKRTVTPSNPPPVSLAIGELALGLGYEEITKQIIIASGTIYRFDQRHYSPGWGNYNIRGKIAPWALSPAAANGDHITLTVIIGAGTNGILSGLYVGEAAGDPNTAVDPPFFVAAPTQLTFGGLGTIAISEGTYISDPVPYATYDQRKALLIATHFSGTINLLEATGARTGGNTWYQAGANNSSQIAPAGTWDYWGSRWPISPVATVLRNPPDTFFHVPADFATDNNTIEAIGAGLNGAFGRNDGGLSGAGGEGGCYAKIVNFNPHGRQEISFQIGAANGTIGAGTAPTANSWFNDAATLIAAGGDNTTVNCVGEIIFPGGAGGPGTIGGGGGGGGGAGGPNGAGAAGVVGLPAGNPPSQYYSGGAGGRAGGLAGGLGGAAGSAASGYGGGFGDKGIELDSVGSGGGGGGGSGNAISLALGGITSGFQGGDAGFYGGGGGGGGSTSGPTALSGSAGRAAEGVLIVTYLAETGPRMWTGTSGGVVELFASDEIVEDAPSDAIYGRSNGEWLGVPALSPTAPTNPAPNMLWCDTSCMRLYTYFQGQWVERAL